jgi:hypothetical protein
MMLGDSWRLNSRYVCVMYGGDEQGNGNYLGADIVQAGHHCNVGCERILYKRINAAAVLVSNSASTFNSYMYWTNLSESNRSRARAYLYMADVYLIDNPATRYVWAAPYHDDVTISPAGGDFNVLVFTPEGPDCDGIYDLFTGETIVYNAGKASFNAKDKPCYIKKGSNNGEKTGDTVRTGAHVASITSNGTTYYYTNFVYAVLDAAANETIVILKNLTVTESIAIDKLLTITADGSYTVTYAADDALFRLARGMSITITGASDSAKLIFTTGGSSLLRGGGAYSATLTNTVISIAETQYDVSGTYTVTGKSITLDQCESVALADVIAARLLGFNVRTTSDDATSHVYFQGFLLFEIATDASVLAMTAKNELVC